MEDESSYTVRTENGLVRLMSEEDVGKFVRSSMQRAKSSSAKAASFTKNRSRRAASPRQDLGPVLNTNEIAPTQMPVTRTTNAPSHNGELEAKEKQQQDQSDLVREASRRIASRSRLIPRKEARTDTSSRDEKVTEREKIPQSNDPPIGSNVKIDDKQSSQLDSFPRDDDRDQQSKDSVKSTIDKLNVKSTDKKRLPIWFSYLAENDAIKTSEDKRSFTVNTEAEGKKNLSESEINNLVRSSIQRARQLAKSKTRRHSPRTKESTNRKSKEKKDTSLRKTTAPSPLGTIHRKFTWSFEVSDDDGEAVILDRRINEALTRKSERKKLDQTRRRAAKSQTVSRALESIESEPAASDKILEFNSINPSISHTNRQTTKHENDQPNEAVEYTQHDYELEVKETAQVHEVGEMSAADVQDILSGHEELLAVTEDTSAELEQIGGNVLQGHDPAMPPKSIIDKEGNEGRDECSIDESALLVPVQPITETYSIIKENENDSEQCQPDSKQDHIHNSNASLILTDATSKAAQEVADPQDDEMKEKQPLTLSEVFQNSLTFRERLEPLAIPAKDDVSPESNLYNESEIRASDQDNPPKNETIGSAALPIESNSQKARSFLLGASNSDLKESLTQGGEISLPSLSVNFTSADECITSHGFDRNVSQKELEVDTSLNETGKDMIHDSEQTDVQHALTALTTILENLRNAEKTLESENFETHKNGTQPSNHDLMTTLITETNASEKTVDQNPLDREQEASQHFSDETRGALTEQLRQKELNVDDSNLGTLVQVDLIRQSEADIKDQGNEDEKQASGTSFGDDACPPVSSKDVIENVTLGTSTTSKRSTITDSSRPPLPAKVVDSHVGVVSHRPNGSPISFREEPFLQMKESASSSDEYPVTRTLKYKFSNSTKSDLITTDSGRRSRRSRRSKKTTRKQKESSDVDEVIITDELIAEIAAKKGAKVTAEELNEMVKSLAPPKPVESTVDSKGESMTHVDESSVPLESKLSQDTETHAPVDNERQSKTSPTKNPGFAPHIRSRFCMDFLDIFQQLVNDPDDETIEEETLNSTVVTWVESTEENGTRQRKKKYESDGGFDEIQEKSRVTFSFSDAEQQTTDEYTDDYSTADETRDNKIEWPSWRV